MRFAKVQVGSVFPPTSPERVALLRFIVSAQALTAIARLVEGLPEGSPPHEESEAYLLFLALGSANEAALAFQKADSLGCFEGLESEGDPEVVSRLGHLRHECDHTRADSLRSRLVRFARNKAGFHWDLGEIKKAIASASTEVVPVAKAGGDIKSGRDLAIPVATATALRVLRLRFDSEGSLDEVLSDAARLQGSLAHVAHAAYAFALASPVTVSQTSAGHQSEGEQ